MTRDKYKQLWNNTTKYTHTRTHAQMQPLCSSRAFARTTSVSRYQKKYSPTHMVINHPLSASSIYPWYPLRSIYMPDSLFPQSLSKFSLVYLLAWHPPLHTPYTSSPNHCLLFAARPYHCNLFCCSTEIMSSNASPSLNPLLGTLSCSLIPHIYLTILISAH